MSGSPLAPSDGRRETGDGRRETGTVTARTSQRLRGVVGALAGLLFVGGLAGVFTYVSAGGLAAATFTGVPVGVVGTLVVGYLATRIGGGTGDHYSSVWKFLLDSIRQPSSSRATRPNRWAASNRLPNATITLESPPASARVSPCGGTSRSTSAGLERSGVSSSCRARTSGLFGTSCSSTSAH